MRVLYIQPGRGVGGSKISLAALLEADLAERKSQVVLSPPVDVMFAAMVGRQVEKIHPVYLPAWLKRDHRSLGSRLLASLGQIKRGWYLSPAWRLANVIRGEKIALVHTNNSVTPAGALAAWLTGTPHVWHVREPIGMGSSFPLVLCDRTAVEFMHRTSQAIICNSEYTAGIFRKFGVEVHVILNGLELAGFEQSQAKGRELRQNLGLSPDGPVVGMVGSLGANWKEHGLFIDAMKQVKDRHAGCQFVIFGGTSNLSRTEYTRSLIKKAGELGLQDELVWADHSDDIPALMGSLDLLVHPTSGEGSGRVVMEAIAAGIPVAAVQSGGVQELIRQGETGLLVPPRDAQVLAAAVLELLGSPGRRLEMGEKARRYAQEHFSHERTVAEIAQVYRDVLAPHKHRGDAG